jgi:hypothetical protein
MQLKELRIRRRESWEPNSGQLVGEVTFVTPTSETKLALDETLAGQILLLCAEGISRSANQVASLLVTDLKRDVPSLEHKDAEDTTNF